MNEPKLYLKRAEEFLEEARLLYEKGFWGGTTNRAYYAMFTAARALLHFKKIQAKTHTGVHQKFNELLVKESILSIHLAKMLTRAYQYRQEADYELEEDINEETATNIFTDAQIFLEKLKDFLMKEFI